VKRQVEVTRIYEWNRDAEKNVICNVGGARSSKSYSITQLLVQKFVSETDKKMLITRKTLPSLRLTTYKVFVDLLKDYGYYDLCVHNKSNYTIEFERNNNIVYFMGLDDNEKIKSSEFNYAFMEEVTEFTYLDYMILKMRMSGRTTPDQPNKLYLALNPSDEFSWVNTKLMHADDVQVLHSTYRDNPFLSSTYTKSLEDLKDQDMTLYKIYALGLWAELENLIYRNWVEKTGSAEYVGNPVFPYMDLPAKRFEQSYGLDFGYNNPCALVWVGEFDGVFYVRQVVYDVHLTNQDLIELMGERGVDKRVPIFADSAEPKSIQDLRNAGYHVVPATKNVLDGIKSVKSHRLLVDNTSTDVLKEFRGYKWREDKNMNVLDEPVKFNDHAMDAIRYGIASREQEVLNDRFSTVSSKRKW